MKVYAITGLVSLIILRFFEYTFTSDESKYLDWNEIRERGSIKIIGSPFSRQTWDSVTSRFFERNLRRKFKKSNPFIDIMADDATKVDQVTAEMDELSFDPSMKKKKSSARKKSVAFEDPSTAEVIPDSSEAAGITPSY